MTNACWLKNDNPYGQSYDNFGNVCTNYGKSDWITAIAVFSILGVILIGLAIGWIVRYSKRAARFRAFWNQPTSRDADFIELKTTSPHISQTHDGFSPPSPSSPSLQPLKRPRYAVPLSSSRPLSMSGGASSRGSSIYSNDTYQQDSSKSRKSVAGSRRGSSSGGGHDIGDRSSVGGGTSSSQERPRAKRSPLSTFGLDEASSGSGGGEDNGMLSPRGRHGLGQWGEAAAARYSDGGEGALSSGSGGSGNGGSRGQVYHPSSPTSSPKNTLGPNSSSSALASYGPDHSFDSENDSDGYYEPQLFSPPTPTASPLARESRFGREEEDDEAIGTFVPPKPSPSPTPSGRGERF